VRLLGGEPPNLLPLRLPVELLITRPRIGLVRVEDAGHSRSNPVTFMRF
jgi:hypothetical protein